MTDHKKSTDIGSLDVMAAADIASTDKIRVLDVSAGEEYAATISVLGTALGIAKGQTTLTSAATTVATGLSLVTSVVACLESDPVLTCDRAIGTKGDQSASPIAGSIILKAFMPTATGDATPIAATGYASKKVNWIAIGTP